MGRNKYSAGEGTLIQAKIEREGKSPQGSLAGKGKGSPGKGPEALIALDINR